MCSFTLNIAKKDEIEHILEYIMPIKEVYQKLRFEAETFQMVQGTSGVSHLVDFFAKRETDRLVTHIARILIEQGIKPEEVLKHYAISLNVNPTKSILVALPQLDRESEVYSKQFNLEVIQGENLEIVIPKLASIVQNR